MKGRTVFWGICLCWICVGTAWAVSYSPPWSDGLHSPNEPRRFLYSTTMSGSPFSSVTPRPKLPEEPDEFDEREVEAYYDWRNDMFFRKFDMEGTGTVDFMTARRTYKVWLDEFGTPVVLTVGDPVFYWIDLNGNGTFEQELGEMFKDSYEDGVTGNEEPYDSSELQSPAGPGPLWNPPNSDGF